MVAARVEVEIAFLHVNGWFMGWLNTPFLVKVHSFLHAGGVYVQFPERDRASILSTLEALDGVMAGPRHMQP